MLRSSLRARGAVVLAVVALLAACTGHPDEAAPATPTTDSPRTDSPAAETPTAPQVPPDDPDVARREAPSGRPPLGPSEQELARFHDQELAWEGCAGAECAEVEVPVSYDDLDGETVHLRAVRRPADGESQGMLVVDLGEHGTGGAPFTDVVEDLLSPEILAAYDVVHLDRRGAANSAPAACLEHADLDRLLAISAPEAAAADRAAEIEAIATACREARGELLDHLDAFSAARDLDILRAASGEIQLNLYGRASGTYLGAMYLNLFPEDVRRMVLDGGINAALSGHEVPLAQAVAHEEALGHYADRCAAAGDCPLGEDTAGVTDRIRGLLEDLGASPIPAGSGGRELTAPAALAAVAAALHDPAREAELTTALRDALDGDGEPLLTLAEDAFSLAAGPGARESALDSAWTTSCVNRPVTEPAQWANLPEALSEASPTFGTWLAAREAMCEALTSTYAEPAPRWMEAPGTGPVLVLQTTEDPVTPYGWSVRQAAHLLTASPVVYEGEGHGAYGREACVTDAVDRYLLEATVPPVGLEC